MVNSTEVVPECRVLLSEVKVVVLTGSSLVLFPWPSVKGGGTEVEVCSGRRVDVNLEGSVGLRVKVGLRLELGTFSVPLCVLVLPSCGKSEWVGAGRPSVGADGVFGEGTPSSDLVGRRLPPECAVAVGRLLLEEVRVEAISLAFEGDGRTGKCPEASTEGSSVFGVGDKLDDGGGELRPCE